MNTERVYVSQRMIRIRQRYAIAIGLVVLSGLARAGAQIPDPAAPASSLLPGSEEGFVDSGGVKIHYVSLGEQPGSAGRHDPRVSRFLVLVASSDARDRGQALPCRGDRPARLQPERPA